MNIIQILYIVQIVEQCDMAMKMGMNEASETLNSYIYRCSFMYFHSNALKLSHTVMIEWDKFWEQHSWSNTPSGKGITFCPLDTFLQATMVELSWNLWWSGKMVRPPPKRYGTRASVGLSAAPSRLFLSKPANYLLQVSCYWSVSTVPNQSRIPRSWLAGIDSHSEHVRATAGCPLFRV